MIALTIFILSTYLVLWTYAGYPLFMYVLSKYYPVEHTPQTGYETDITVIMAVANAADKIYDKLCNTFKTNYPLDKMEVIIVMDGYCAETEKQVSNFVTTYFAHKNQVHLRKVEKGGKEKALAVGVQQARGKICIFTDVGTTIGRTVLHKLVSHFADPEVGAVDGMSRVVSDGHSNEGLYLKYENKIRQWESETSGLVGMGGCLFAALRAPLQDTMLLNTGGNIKHYPGFVTDQQSDFRTALVMRTFGYRTVLDREAVAEFADGKPEKEFARKHRTLVRGYNVLLHSMHLLDFRKYGWFSYALFNHKLMKWMVPFFMLAAYLSLMVMGMHSLGWSIAWIIATVVGILTFIRYESKFGKMIHFFMLTNIAVLYAWWSYIRGERFVFWEPTKR